MRNTDNLYLYDWMFERLNLSDSELLVYAIIQNINYNTGKLLTCTVQKIANSIGKTYRSTTRIISRLICNGYVKKIKFLKNGYICFGYSVTDKGVPDDVPFVENYLEPDFNYPLICKKSDNTRFNYQYKKWRNDILERDGYKCKQCGLSENLHVHHLKPYSQYPALRFETSNGITLCEKCHKELHKKGRENNGKT